MNTPSPLPPAAIPWYKSGVLKGILVAVVAQGLLRLKAQFGIDLTLYGVDANSAAMWIMDIVSAGALAYVARARVSKPMPVITAGPKQAAAINTVSPPPATPAIVRASTPPEDTQ